MIRYLGAAALVLSAWAAGALIAAAERDTPKAVNSLYGLAVYMLRRIKTGRAPLRGIFADFSDGYLEKCGFLEILRRPGDIPALWQSAIGKLPLSGSARREALTFGADLGRLGLEEQEKRLEAFIPFLAAERERAENGLKNRQKSIRISAALAGILIAIILI